MTTFDSPDSVIDYYDPATQTKLMVVTNFDGGALAVAAVNYETGEQIALDWFPKDPEALDFQVYGFANGDIWATSKGRPVVFSMQGEEVPEASEWVTFPRYVGQGWAVLSAVDDPNSTGVAFPGDFDPALTTQALKDLE